GERLGAAGLHLAEEEYPETDEEEVREEGDDGAKRLARLFGFDLDVVRAQPNPLTIRDLERQLHRKLGDVLATDDHSMLELAGQLPTALNRDALDVVLRELLVVLRVDEWDRLVRAVAGQRK